MRIIVLLTALMLAPGALAKEPSISYGFGAQRAAIEIEAQADHVLIPLTVVADLEDPLARLEALDTTIKSIRAALLAVEGIRVEAGSAKLAARRERDRFFSSSSDPSAATLYVFGELGDDGNLFSIAKTVQGALGEIEPPEDVRIRIDNASLSVSDPEAYREPLLNALRSQLDLVRKTLGDARKIRVQGLDKPVRIASKSDREVVLYLEVGYEIEM